MRIKQLLTKTLLAAAGLCVGASAWAAEKTYDFYNYVKVTKNLGKSGEVTTSTTGSAIATADEASVYLVQDLADFSFDGRFAIEDNYVRFRNGNSSKTNNENNLGLQNRYSGGQKHLSVLNLKVGDIVTVKVGTSDTYIMSTNATVEGVAVKSGDKVGSGEATSTVYTITKAGNLDLKMNAWAVILAITINSSSETVTAPTLAITGANGNNRTVTMTPGVSDNDAATVNVYYTTDGTTPTTSSIKYTEPVVFGTATEVTAATISSTGVSSPTTTLSVDAGSYIVLPKPSIAITDFAKNGTYSYPVVQITQSNAVYGSPVITLSYDLDGTDVTSDVTEGKYTFTNSGKLTVTAAADGFTSSSSDFTSNAHVQTLTYDFTNASFTGTYTDGKTSNYWPTGGSYRFSSAEKFDNTLTSVNTYQVSWDGTPFDFITLQADMPLIEGVGIVNVYTGDRYFKITTAPENGYAVYTLKYNGNNGSGSEARQIISASDIKATENAKILQWSCLRNATIYNQVPATVSPSVTDYATFSSPYALDFTSATGVKAYYASASDGSVVEMTKVTGAVAAGTGLLLQKVDGEISIPVAATGTDLSATNLLKAGTGADVVSDAEYSRYVLAGEGDATSFYNLATAYAVPVGKAYLEVAKSTGARLAIVFSDGETTGIANVEKTNAVAEGIYNLNGQRVAAPQKGLYIVNGKKVIKK